MKALLLCLLLTGCATCKECVTLTPAQLGTAMQKAWAHGFNKGYEAGEDSKDLERLKAL